MTKVSLIIKTKYYMIRYQKDYKNMYKVLIVNVSRKYFGMANIGVDSVVLLTQT